MTEPAKARTSFRDTFYARTNRTSSSNSTVDSPGIAIYRRVSGVDVSTNDDYEDVRFKRIYSRLGK